MKPDKTVYPDHNQVALELRELCFGRNPRTSEVTINSGGVAAKCARHLALRRGMEASPSQVEEAAQAALVAAWSDWLTTGESSRLVAYRAAGVALNHEFSQGKVGRLAESASESINTVPIDLVLEETSLAYDQDLDPDPCDRPPGEIARVNAGLDRVKAKLPATKGRRGDCHKAVFKLVVAIANGSSLFEAARLAGYSGEKSALQAARAVGILPPKVHIR